MGDVNFIDEDKRSSKEIEEEYGVWECFIKKDINNLRVTYESTTSKNNKTKKLEVYKQKKIGGDYANDEDPIRYLYCKDSNDDKYKIHLELGYVSKRVNTKRRYTWRRISTRFGIKEIERL